MHCHTKQTLRDTKADSAPTSPMVKRGMLATAVVAVGVHLPCLIGWGSAALGVGGAAALWCGHGGVEANTSFGLDLPQLPKVPDDISKISASQNKEAKMLLLEAQPNFQAVIEAKQAEAGGAPVQVVFLKSPDDRASVVCCLNGELCPCSIPQVYELGTKSDLERPELYPRQHELLRLIFGQ